jgi:hypothetical protein
MQKLRRYFPISKKNPYRKVPPNLYRFHTGSRWDPFTICHFRVSIQQKSTKKDKNWNNKKRQIWRGGSRGGAPVRRCGGRRAHGCRSSRPRTRDGCAPARRPSVWRPTPPPVSLPLEFLSDDGCASGNGWAAASYGRREVAKRGTEGTSGRRAGERPAARFEDGEFFRVSGQVGQFIPLLLWAASWLVESGGCFLQNSHARISSHTDGRIRSGRHNARSYYLSLGVTFQGPSALVGTPAGLAARGVRLKATWSWWPLS